MNFDMKLSLIFGTTYSEEVLLSFAMRGLSGNFSNIRSLKGKSSLTSEESSLGRRDGQEVHFGEFSHISNKVVIRALNVQIDVCLHCSRLLFGHSKLYIEGGPT